MRTVIVFDTECLQPHDAQSTMRNIAAEPIADSRLGVLRASREQAMVERNEVNRRLLAAEQRLTGLNQRLAALRTKDGLDQIARWQAEREVLRQTVPALRAALSDLTARIDRGLVEITYTEDRCYTLRRTIEEHINANRLVPVGPVNELVALIGIVEDAAVAAVA